MSVCERQIDVFSGTPDCFYYQLDLDQGRLQIEEKNNCFSDIYIDNIFILKSSLIAHALF